MENNELQYNLRKFEEDENHIEYFISIFPEYIKSNPEKAKEILDLVMEIALNKEYELAYGWCLMYIGWYCFTISDYTNACKYRLDANEIFIKNNCVKGLIFSYNGLLADYTRLGNLELAIESGLSGIDLAEKENDEKALIHLMINTAIAYMDYRKYDEAKRLLNKINEVYRQIQGSELIVYYITLAEVEVISGDINKGYECCEVAIELIKELGCWIYECEILSIRAEANSKLGKNKEAEIYFEVAIKSAKSFKNIIYIVKTLRRWAKHYNRIGELDKAEKKLIEAFNEVNSLNSLLDKSEICYELNELYAQLKRYEEAYKFLKEHLEIEKEIFNNKSSSWLARLHNKEITREAKIYRELYQEIDLLSGIGKKFTSDLKIERNLEVIYEEVKELMEADVFGIASYSKEEKILKYDLFIVNGKRKNCGISALEEENFGTWCYKNKENIVINDMENEYRKYVPSRNKGIEDDNCNVKNIKSAIFCPIVVENEVLGILTVQSYKKNSYNKNTVKKLEILASYIAIALENAKLFKNIEYSATHDWLTDVYNRKEILKRGQTIIQNNKGCSVMIMDIDYFKSINDNYGHATGDYVLKTISDLMKKDIKGNGYIGRYGGEEFLIVVNSSNKEYVSVLANNIRKNIENYNFIVDSKKINVTVSIGVYNYLKDDKYFNKHIKLADEALYLAKLFGRNRVVNY